MSHSQSQPDNEIDRLQADVDRLETELVEAKERLTRAKIAICGVAIGDIVVRKGKRFRVCEIDVHWTTSPPWLKGNVLLKDGSWSLAARNLYGDWTKELRS